MINHTILPGISLCVFTLQKDTSSKEVINEVKKCIGDSRWRPHYDILIDLRLLDAMFPYEEFESVRDFILSTPISKDAKRAMVISTPKAKSDSQKWAQEIKPHNLTYWTFSSLENALNWIGVSLEDYQVHVFHSKL